MENTAVEMQPSGLSGIRLKFGEVLQLQLPGEDDRYDVRLIGYLQNRSFIITAPVYNSRLIRFRSGEPVIVRMMVSGVACAFTSNVMKSHSLPYPHVHLEYPVDLVTNSVRNAVRVESRAHGKIFNRSIGARAKELSCYLADISETGAHLVTQIRVGKSGDEIGLTIKLDTGGMNRMLEVAAILKGRLKVKSDPDAREVHYGVQFCEMSDAQRIELIAYIYSKLFTAL